MTAIGALIVVGGGAYAVLDNVTTVTLPTVRSPDMTTSFSKSEPRHLESPMQSPMPKPVATPAPTPQSKEVAARRLRPGHLSM